jgi:iron complex outermembrane receptor protein
VVALLLARPAPAQSRACVTGRGDAAASAPRFMPPLDRLITLHASEISLRDALDRMSASANLRVSYSADLLPLNRAVCVDASSVPVGRVLTELLAGTTVAPVGAGGDQVVLAPRGPNAERRSAPEMARSLRMLDRVVVTGSATGASAPERELSIGLNVIDGRQLERTNTQTLSDALDAYVPGVWGWAQSPSSMITSYASIRGASSFGLSYPKIYIDGIEVANPLLLSRFNPASVDHIEVIRGPQGSALYGVDAISGVVNIVTRHEGAPVDGGVGSLRTTAGISESQFSGDVLAQQHALSLATGTSTRSANLHVAGGSLGSFVPNGYSHDLMATASARMVGATSSLSATARLLAERAGTPNSPLVPTAPHAPGDTTGARDVPQAVTEYTVGATGTTSIDDEWQFAAVAGVDGYRLRNVQTNFTPIPSSLDSALRAAQGGADRATMRVSGVYRSGNDTTWHSTLTLAAEHATLRVSSERTTQVVQAPSMHMGSSMTSVQRVVSWQNSTGIVVQSNVALRNSLFLTGGVRFEHDSRLAGVDQVETLPLLGASFVSDAGPFTVKLRSSYGKGIRPPTTPSRLQFWQLEDHQFVSQGPLGPERQSGFESGIDVTLHRALSLQVTRFDQLASGLIQQVGIPVDTDEPSHRMIFVAQNVGEITNRGWEISGTANLSRLAVTGALTFVDSRVKKLASGYTGDLATGDRMLQVPKRTESIGLSWLADRWRVGLNGSRAADWINYDEVLLTQAFASSTRTARDLTGQKLRQYWSRYDGALRLRATASRDIRDALAIEVSGDNLLNHQVGEPDNITIVPGRTLMTGFRVRF